MSEALSVQILLSMLGAAHLFCLGTLCIFEHNIFYYYLRVSDSSGLLDLLCPSRKNGCQQQHREST